MRLIVARSVGYVVLLSILGVIYVIAAFMLVSRVLYVGQTIPVSIEIAFTVLALILAMSFQPLKKRFDRLSNRIFYRDAYDVQELLDEFNKALVSDIKLDNLLKRSVDTVQKYIKPAYCVIGVQKDIKSPRYVQGNAELEYSEEDIAMLYEVATSYPDIVLAVDFLDEQHQELQTALQSKGIAIIARLVNQSRAGDPDIGYMVLGQKSSGNSYNSQDVKAIEILANELVIAVQNSLRYEEIESFNITLQKKVEDATRKLRKTNEKLKKLDEAKDDFISMASHQLRTPLTSIKGYISMVMDGDGGKITSKQQRLLGQAFVSSQRMVFLISDLLNVSRLKTGKFVITPEPTRLDEIIEQEINQLDETIKARGLSLTYNKPQNFPVLMLDETKIRQVVVNFIDNAIYYTPRDGHISVKLEDKGSSIEYTVKDDGIGVPADEKHHLFTKFYRAGNAKKARPDGTGLGLFMAKKVILAQGGSIIFSSVENKGSTFGFSIVKSRLQEVI